VFAALQKRAIEEGFLEPKVAYGYFRRRPTGTT
jgi:hypothetical protein